MNWHRRLSVMAPVVLAAGHAVSGQSLTKRARIGTGPPERELSLLRYREIPNAAHSAVRDICCHRHPEMNCSR
jgi:hypothetical protein